jgi:plastocyanin
MRQIIFAIIILVVLGIVGYFSLHSIRKPNKKEGGETKVTNSPTRAPEKTITLTDEGFTPNDVTIKVGEAVRFVNKSTQEQSSVNSDDHPTHQKHQELNFGIFTKDGTFMYLFTKPGSYGYHNHFLPEQRGTILVIK